LSSKCPLFYNFVLTRDKFLFEILHNRI
jgi:hypothetical protein